MLPPPPPRGGRRRKTTRWGAEAPRRGPAHANRAGGGQNPDSEIHAAPPRRGGRPKQDAAAATGTEPRPEFTGASRPGERRRARRECSPDPPAAESPGSGAEASLGARAGVPGGRAAAARGPQAAPPGARAPFPPEFPSGSSDSRGKLNILGQGEASCQVSTSRGALPPPAPPPPPPPTPRRPRRHRPPKYQLSRRDRGAAAAAAAARGRVLCSPRSGPSRQAEKVAFPRETLLGNQGIWGRAGGTGTSLPLAPVRRGGEEGTRAGGAG